VDAFTFSTSLVAFSDALLELNRQISPNLSIEITIEGIGPGSFRAKIGTKLKSLASFFAPDARELLISLLAAFIYTRIDSQSTPQIIVNDDSVIVVSGSDRVIIPRKTWDAKGQLPKPKAVEKHVAKAFEIIEDDPSVSDFGFVAKRCTPGWRNSKTTVCYISEASGRRQKARERPLRVPASPIDKKKAPAGGGLGRRRRVRSIPID
jgi:hypothetical protein